MTKAGVVCDDVRIKRLVALVAQKFVTDVANDAMHYHRLRQGSGTTAAGGASAKDKRAGVAAKKTCLTMDDLTAALHDYGVNVKRPSYYL